MHDPGEETQPSRTPAEAHQVTLAERGPFISPRCTCGWYGPARRSRPLARHEAASHLAEFPS